MKYVTNEKQKFHVNLLDRIKGGSNMTGTDFF
jgi:hypothetical protein